MLKTKARFLYMILVGIAVAILLKATVYDTIQNHPRIYDYLAAIVITIIVWEGNLWIDHWMNIQYPWVLKTTKRILFHLPIALIFSAIALYVLMLTYDTWVCGLNAQHKKLMAASLYISFLITILLLSFEIGGQLLKGWKLSLIEVERYKTETVQAQLQNLKDQINPHFLFNNLSVLSSLVYINQDKAVDFINQLSKVYRYLLDNRTNELVRLEDEMKFLESYIYLIQIRFDRNIHFEIDIDPNKLKDYIPPMSLQMLIENVIKHNEISGEFPLSVWVNIKDNMLEVRNSLKARMADEVSSKSGLNNIQERYKYFTEIPMEIIKSEHEFIVRIPLLSNL
ncbi:MAG TPA: histidine kinase [Chitinophagaceae bacterium]|nr:histidine kinase [Chitinophagaceae bacterium]